MLTTQSSSSLQVPGLYEHRVVVANESDAERNRAFREALEAVLLKVTGDRRWLSAPVIQQAISNAQSYVEAISYSSEATEVSTDAVDPEQGEQMIGDQQENDVASLNDSQTREIRETRYINVNFAQSLLDDLLAGADIPVWDSNRPSVLVWMALQNNEGERSMATADSNPEIISFMQKFAAERGLPIIFPVLDFEDRRALTEDAVWALDEDVIRRASERYGADSVLSGRLHFTISGELVGLWQFIFQGQAEVFDGFDEELETYLDEPLDRITNQLASHFALIPEATNQQIVRIQVEGIRDLSAYSALLNYISSLGLVESVITTAFEGQLLELQLGLLGNTQQLFELIALDRDLLPVTNSQLLNESALTYRWTR
ncbi:MAG: DUF2066 domain-containing protein [Pseudohongiellaceae bacterium]